MFAEQLYPSRFRKALRRRLVLTQFKNLSDQTVAFVGAAAHSEVAKFDELVAQRVLDGKFNTVSCGHGVKSNRPRCRNTSVG